MKYIKQHLTINKFPDELKEAAFTKSKRTWTDVLRIKGPGSSAFLIEILAKNVYEVRFLMNFILREHSCKYDTTIISKFDKYGAILTKPVKNYEQRLKELTPDLRSVNAVKVVEKKNTKQFIFLCLADVMLTTSKKLEALGYGIESVEIEYFPKERVVLNKHDRQLCDKFIEVLSCVPHVLSIYDNIHRG